MIHYRFRDQHDANCYLCVDILLDGSVSIHGWNDNSDGFTGIDLAPKDATELAAVLQHVLAELRLAGLATEASDV